MIFLESMLAFDGVSHIDIGCGGFIQLCLRLGMKLSELRSHD